jgi:hypothetical protein
MFDGSWIPNESTPMVTQEELHRLVSALERGLGRDATEEEGVRLAEWVEDVRGMCERIEAVMNGKDAIIKPEHGGYSVTLE